MRDDRPNENVGGVKREQDCYARLLWWSGWTGLAVLVIGFAVYAFGMLPPLISVEALPSVWTLSAQQLRVQQGHPAGWNWIRLLGHGDIFNLVGIALLAGCSAIPLLAVTGLYWQQRERLYAALTAAQIVVMFAAASGLITAGH